MVWQLLVADCAKQTKKRQRAQLKFQPPTSSRRKRTNEAAALAPDTNPHHTRTLGEWSAMSPEVLRLVATDNHIPHSTPETLSVTLFNHFQAQRLAMESASSSSAGSMPLRPFTDVQMPPLLPLQNQPIPTIANPFELPPDISAELDSMSSFQRETQPLLQTTTATSPAHLSTHVSVAHQQVCTPAPNQDLMDSVARSSESTALHQSLIAQNALLFEQLQALSRRIESLQMSHSSVIASVNSAISRTTASSASVNELHNVRRFFAPTPPPNVPYFAPVSTNHRRTSVAPTQASCSATWNSVLQDAIVTSSNQFPLMSVAVNQPATSSQPPSASVVTASAANDFLLPQHPFANQVLQLQQSYNDAEYRLPPIRVNIMEKIRAGKCIDLSALVPRAALEPRESFQMLVDADDDSGHPRVNVVPKSVHSQIKTFHEWLAAFLTYAQAYLRFFPNKAGGIFAYISQITRYSTRYPLKAVLLYDRHFRQKIALFHPNSFWGVVDNVIFDEYLGGRSFPAYAANSASSSRAGSTCFRCGLLGHLAASCPSAVSSAPTVPSLFSTSVAQPPFLAPQRPTQGQRTTTFGQSTTFRMPRPSSFSFDARRAATPDTLICKAFATYGSCTRGQCGYAHLCPSCRRPGHNASRCPNKQ